MNENSKGSSHTSPALPDVKALFDLILSIDKTSQSVRFRFRTEDIYLIGFKMEPNGIWYAFDDTKQLIQGSQSLGFDSTYKAKIVNMSIGFESLKQAIINLATGNDRNARPHDLTIAIMMTSESVRFKPVAELMQCALHKHDKPLVIESWVEQLVHNWEDLCEFVHLSNSKSGVKNEELKKIQKRLEDKHLKVPYNFDRDRPGRDLGSGFEVWGLGLGLDSSLGFGVRGPGVSLSGSEFGSGSESGFRLGSGRSARSGPSLGSYGPVHSRIGLCHGMV
ncbi:hypothetical protein G4B88_019033 [Cannabis sativa]|uniref:rRNA N-glycosylase n=1 Tax=Cannabis sativa TaxID=3483 RepID=A0A7J6H0L4_CANSA|nr:hypothetical protein G4B88_019033 [Cannabis sativa]